MDRVLGVLAGESLPADVLRAWCDSATLVLAADGGADRVLAVERRPHRVVGDLDSLSERARRLGLDVRHDPDQDCSDCDKLLRLAEECGASAVTLACVEGGYLDHLLAVLSSALRSPLSVRLALRTGVAWVLRAPARLQAATSPGRRVSLMPLLRCTGVRLEGVRWRLDGAELDWTGLVSLSNRAESDRIEARLAAGAALLFVQYPAEEVPFW
ncbi:MAG: thiamine diphosphokinase [Fimbriimonadales bacterium]|nr:thiamine diphosphokinase [Fimbriimonadales bacterium]